VIPVERRPATGVMARSTTPTAATTAGAMVATTHAFHIHTGVVVLSRCGQTGGVLGRFCMRAPRAIPSVNLIPSALILAGATPMTGCATCKNPRDAAVPANSGI
jgi:hypothetical protein